ncbi:MAG TPA: primosomal protein N', partial [Agriterribacter sp.]|nr:primosomal protein N' [Agriterribacter sp.]
RAGRKAERGNVLIQVINTKHPVLHFVKQHDYSSFFKYEMEGRERFFYPPFSRIILITFRHKLKEVVKEASQAFALGLRKKLEKYIVGPAEPPINRVRNQYLMELLLKLPRDTLFIHRSKIFIREQINDMHQDKKFRSVVMVVNVDPV